MQEEMVKPCSRFALCFDKDPPGFLILVLHLLTQNQISGTAQSHAFPLDESQLGCVELFSVASHRKQTGFGMDLGSSHKLQRLSSCLCTFHLFWWVRLDFVSVLHMFSSPALQDSSACATSKECQQEINIRTCKILRMRADPYNKAESNSRQILRLLWIEMSPKFGFGFCVCFFVPPHKIWLWPGILSEFECWSSLPAGEMNGFSLSLERSGAFQSRSTVKWGVRFIGLSQWQSHVRYRHVKHRHLLAWL